jgi:hypothetical protein
MKTNFGLLFYMKKPKNYQSGTAPIYMRIIVNGKRSEVTTGCECDPARWNIHSGRANGTKRQPWWPLFSRPAVPVFLLFVLMDTGSELQV